jgi:hypothetical protein
MKDSTGTVDVRSDPFLMVAEGKEKVFLVAIAEF